MPSNGLESLGLNRVWAVVVPLAHFGWMAVGPILIALVLARGPRLLPLAGAIVANMIAHFLVDRSAIFTEIVSLRFPVSGIAELLSLVTSHFSEDCGSRMAESPAVTSLAKCCETPRT